MEFLIPAEDPPTRRRNGGPVRAPSKVRKPIGEVCRSQCGKGSASGTAACRRGEGRQNGATSGNGRL
jgi:hypothetical protein